MNFPVLPEGPLWPAATLVAAAFFATGALTSTTVPAPSRAFTRPAAIDISQSEILACEGAGTRSHSECMREAEGKALIRHAEWVAELEESKVGDVAESPMQAGGVIVLRPQRHISN